MANGRRGNKLDKDVSKAVLKKVKVDIPDLGQGCPDNAEGFFATHIVASNKLNQLMGKLQPQLQKLIKIQAEDILESLDPKNIGKSREIKIPNPSFNLKEKRSDSDTTPFTGDNPFWMKSYESVYDRDRFRPNVVEDMKKLLIGQNKEIVQQYKEALQEVYALREELEDKKDEMDKGEVPKKKEEGLLGDEWFN